MYSISFVVPSWHYWMDPLKHQPYWELYYATVLRARYPETEAAIDLHDLRGARKGSLEDAVADIPERDAYVYWIMKTGDAMEVYSIARLLKARYPRSIHVAGGTHVDMCTDECLEYFDAVVVGPGENSFPQAIEDSRCGRLERAYRQDYRDVPFLDTPVPRRDFLSDDRAANREIFKEYGGATATLVYFSRGCVYKCAFCVYNVPSYLQVRSPERMREELEYLKARYRIEGILLKDEVAIHPNRKIAATVFEALGGAGIVWRGQTTTMASAEDLRLARESGCLELAVGVETVDEQVMRIINKEWQSQRQIRDFIDNARKVGIKVKVCLIYGLPGEPADIVEKTLKFLEETRPDYVSLSGFCPLPGSPMFRNPERYGIKRIDRDWSKHAHLLYRFSDEEEVGLPFEYEEVTPWGRGFTRDEIKENVRLTQRWLEARGMTW